MRQRRLFIRFVKTAAFVLCLLPLAVLTLQLRNGTLGANPVESVLHDLGLWGLRFLWLTLSLTPLSLLFNWKWTFHLRRMLGLFSFFYITLHILFYVGVDQGFDWYGVWEDVTVRTYLVFGAAAFLLLTPLAVTSNGPSMRLMGRLWKRLHRLIYPAAIFASVHFWLSIKADWREPAIYAAILAGLLLVRVAYYFTRRYVRKTALHPKG